MMYWVNTSVKWSRAVDECALQIEQYAVDFVQHEMDPPFAIDTSDADQVFI